VKNFTLFVLLTICSHNLFAHKFGFEHFSDELIYHTYQERSRLGSTKSDKIDDQMRRILRYKLNRLEKKKETGLNQQDQIRFAKLSFYYHLYRVPYLIKKDKVQEAKKLTLHLIDNIEILESKKIAPFTISLIREFIYCDNKFVFKISDKLQERVDFTKISKRDQFKCAMFFAIVHELRLHYQISNFYLTKAERLLEFVAIQEQTFYHLFRAHNKIRDVQIEDGRAQLSKAKMLLDPDDKISYLHMYHYALLGIYSLWGEEVHADSAKIYAKKALEISIALHDPINQNNNHKLIAHAEYFLKNYEAAIEQVEMAIQCYEGPFRHLSLQDTIFLADIYLDAGFLDEFQNFEKPLLRFLENPDVDVDLNIKASRVLSDYYELMNDLRNSLKIEIIANDKLRDFIDEAFVLNAEELNMLTQKINKELNLANLENKNQALENLLLKRKYQTKLYILLGLLALLGITILILSLRKIRKQNDTLKIKSDFILHQLNLLEENKNKLDKALNEKNILLGELHHRVKNNLQFISSSVNIEACNHPDTSAAEMAELIDRQINVLALSFSKLDFSNSQVIINLKTFLLEICNHCFMIQRINKDNFKFEHDICHLDINMSDAASIGLIVNELLTNAFKHGYDNHYEEYVHIKLELHQTSTSTFSLTISNNGKPLPANIVKNDGITLMEAIALKLKGKLSFITLQPKCTQATLTFQYE